MGYGYFTILLGTPMASLTNLGGQLKARQTFLVDPHFGDYASLTSLTDVLFITEVVNIPSTHIQDI